MEIIKLFLVTGLSFFSAGILLYYWKNKNQLHLRIITIIGIVGKITGILIIYIFFPTLNNNSDAALFYLPQIEQVIAGNIPGIDFKTSYSILFHFIFVPVVYIWSSVGAIALVMVCIECTMIALYLSRGLIKKDSLRWYVVSLYTFSPISFYWIITGYNSIIIALVTIIVFILVENDNNLLAGILMAVGFLITKFLIVLMWPVFIFYQKENIIKRAIPLVILIVLLIFLIQIGFDLTYPVRFEVGRKTSGNLWFLVITAVPTLSTWFWGDLLPIIIFGIIFIPLFYKFFKSIKANSKNSFNIALAFISIICLLFMMLSKKTYPFYLQIFLLFLLHTIIRSKNFMNRTIFVIIFLGATTTIEPYLFQMLNYPISPLFDNKFFIILLIIDILTILSYIHLLVISYQQMITSSRVEITDHLQTN